MWGPGKGKKKQEGQHVYRKKLKVEDRRAGIRKKGSQKGRDRIQSSNGGCLLGLDAEKTLKIDEI